MSSAKSSTNRIAQMRSISIVASPIRRVRFSRGLRVRPRRSPLSSPSQGGASGNRMLAGRTSLKVQSLRTSLSLL
ncbi:hypothetical protein ACRJ4B_00225 [Streptomyces sp. GTA36]